jgi:hypothetical protein
MREDVHLTVMHMLIHTRLYDDDKVELIFLVLKN